MAHNTIIRRPRFSLKFLTETNAYHIIWDAATPNNNFMTESVISLTTKNAMEDDSSAFSFVLSGDMQWEKILNANDMVIMRVYGNQAQMGNTLAEDVDDNNVLIVGLVSEVRREADYNSNSVMYRITGQSLAKAFIQFELNAIRQVNIVMDEFGWLGLKENGGANYAGATVKENIQATINRFMGYMKYSYLEQSNFTDYIKTRIVAELSSWEDEEHLQDVLPFTSFEGSLNQLLIDMTNKPFNEMFFDTYADTEGNEKAKLVVRRTPFEKEDWQKLPRHRITSHNVIKEQLGQADLDAYAIFNVVPGNLQEMDMMSNAKPVYNPELVKKYGYKLLEITNKYLTISSGTSGNTTTETTDETDTDTPETNTTPNTDGTGGAITGGTSGGSGGGSGGGVIAVSTRVGGVNSGGARVDNELGIGLTGGLGLNPNTNTMSPEESKALGLETVNGVLTGRTLEEAEALTEQAEASSENGADILLMQQQSERLYRWYANNPNFFSGDIEVIGDPDYRLGNRLLYVDEYTGDIWEFYIESVEHKYSYTDGFTTALGVTRGIKLASETDEGQRFNLPMGPPLVFAGGYLGEMTIEERKELSEQAGTSSGTGGGSGGGVIPTASGNAIADYGMSLATLDTYYLWGGGHGTDPLTGSAPYGYDCSGFVYWCFKKFGKTIGANGNTTTWGIAADPQFTTLGNVGSGIDPNTDLIAGDVVFFGSTDWHMGIYVGNGNFVGSNGNPNTAGVDYSGGIQIRSMYAPEWSSIFMGHAIRLK